MNPTFTEIDFYDYKIRMCMIDGTKMYLVSDLLRQYNEKQGTEKSFKHYLENKQTQELLRKRYEKSEGQDSDPHKIGTISAEEGDKWNIPHVIQYITYNRGYCDAPNSEPHPEKANQGYIVSSV